VSDTEEEVTPRLYDHALRVYKEMEKLGHKEFPPNDGGQTFDDSDMITVYEGHLTRLFAELQIANPYYTKIMEALKGQNCITQLRRGGGSALSKWCLLTPPSEEGFKAIMDRRRAPRGNKADIDQRLADLTRWVGLLDDKVQELIDARQQGPA